MCSIRFFAVLTAAMLLAVCSGCGSAEKKDSPSAGSGGQTASATSQTASANGGAIDVLPVPPDYFAAVVINLRRITQSPLLADLLKDEEIAEAIRKFGLYPGEIEQIVVPIRIDKTQPGESKLTAFLIARFTHEVDAKDILAKLKPKELIQEVQFGGKTCLDLGPGAGLAYVPGKSTIVLASKENMGSILAVTRPAGPLFERLKRANADVDLIVTGEFENHPGLNKQIDSLKAGALPFLLDYLEIAKTLREGAIAMNLTGDTLLQIGLDTKDPTAATAAEERFKDDKKSLGGSLAGIKQTASKEVKTEYADAFRLGDEAIDSMQVARHGTQVTVTVKRPAGLDKAGPWVDKAVRAYFMLSPPRPGLQPPNNKPMPAQPSKFE